MLCDEVRVWSVAEWSEIGVNVNQDDGGYLLLLVLLAIVSFEFERSAWLESIRRRS